MNGPLVVAFYGVWRSLAVPTHRRMAALHNVSVQKSGQVNHKAAPLSKTCGLHFLKAGLVSSFHVSSPFLRLVRWAWFGYTRSWAVLQGAGKCVTGYESGGVSIHVTCCCPRSRIWVKEGKTQQHKPSCVILAANLELDCWKIGRGGVENKRR